jgi:hypothetical protein
VVSYWLNSYSIEEVATALKSKGQR